MIGRFGARRSILLFGGLAAIGVMAVVVLAWRTATAKPRLEVRFLHYGTNHNAKVAVIGIKNVGRVPVVYRGYAKTSPVCELERRMADGQWGSRILRCGTGLVEQVLYEGEEIRGEIWVTGGANWRAGLRYRKTDIIDSLVSKLHDRVLAVVNSRPQMQVAWSGEMAGLSDEEQDEEQH